MSFEFLRIVTQTMFGVGSAELARSKKKESKEKKRRKGDSKSSRKPRGNSLSSLQRKQGRKKKICSAKKSKSNLPQRRQKAKATKKPYSHA